jgi:membrane associated rhomboid family serine protease
MVWQLVTYMFLHGGIWHFVWNMFGLVIFGRNLELYWGTREFYKYYFVTGIGAGVIQVLTTYLFGEVTWIPVIGASGAIFGVAVAYAMAFPKHTIMLWLVIPISARTLVILYLFMEVARILQNPGGDGVARFAHLGGALVGYLYLKNETLFWRVRRLWSRVQATVEQSQRPRQGGDAHDEERVNEILDKINREPDGIASLTEEERQFLHDARRRKESRDR